jgi:hypothetical protein
VPRSSDPLPDALAADHRHQDVGVGDVVERHRGEVLIEDDQIGELAPLERAGDLLLVHLVGAVDPHRADRLLAREPRQRVELARVLRELGAPVGLAQDQDFQPEPLVERIQAESRRRRAAA